jgi:hypothetical protein
LSLREPLNGTTPGDRILFILLLFVSFIGIVFMKDVLPRSREVTIEVEGNPAYRYPLDTDRRVEVGTPFGHLTVEIRGGKTRVTNASCPNKLCELQGWVSTGVIICLPARVSVVVGGPEKPEDRDVDAITG